MKKDRDNKMERKCMKLGCTKNNRRYLRREKHMELGIWSGGNAFSDELWNGK